jgi:hypothetical protein
MWRLERLQGFNTFLTPHCVTARALSAPTSLTLRDSCRLTLDSIAMASHVLAKTADVTEACFRGEHHPHAFSELCQSIITSPKLRLQSNSIRPNTARTAPTDIGLVSSCLKVADLRLSYPRDHSLRPEDRVQ